MRHLDLFSGIGGFALATEMAWDEVEHIFCDNDPFSQAVLKKHWPNSLIYGDIKKLTAERIAADTESKRRNSGGTFSESNASQDGDRQGSGTGGVYPVTLLTGGFPCQPFSSAGRRRGTEDDRHLWPEMLRVIREVHPTYVLGENVGGFLTWNGGLVFEQVCLDLEAEGYEVCPFVIPAAAVGAPHRRDRVWVAAHAIGSDAGGAPRQFQGTKGTERLRERDDLAISSQPGNARISSSNSSREQTHTTKQSGLHSESSSSIGDASDTVSTGEGKCGKLETPRQCGERGGARSNKRHDWSEDWPTVAARLCTLDDGLSNGLARPRGWRNAALKGAGNAIVPQVAAEILRAMKEIA